VIKQETEATMLHPASHHLVNAGALTAKPQPSLQTMLQITVLLNLFQFDTFQNRRDSSTTGIIQKQNGSPKNCTSAPQPVFYKLHKWPDILSQKIRWWVLYIFQCLTKSNLLLPL